MTKDYYLLNDLSKGMLLWTIKEFKCEAYLGVD